MCVCVCDKRHLFQSLGKLFYGRGAPDFAIQVLALSGLISLSEFGIRV